MSFRIAQIGFTVPKGTKRNQAPFITDEHVEIDIYAASIPERTRAGLIRSINELEQSHEKNPYKM